MSKIIYGTWCEIPSVISANAIARAGMDFLIIDLEHGGIDFETVQSMVFSIQAEKKKAFVRVSEESIGSILPVLDMGIDGIQIPHVKNEKDVKMIVEHCYYPPIGRRGFNPFTRSCGYHSVNQKYLNALNKKLSLSVIIENEEGLKNIISIASNKNIDIIYLGQYDLSVSLGIPGEMEHPVLLKKMTDAVQIINKYSKSAGCMVHSIEAAKKASKDSYQFIMYTVDTNILYIAYNAFMKGVKEI
jgi:4-hydroxy-2-oxoheptanedioate aldolase